MQRTVHVLGERLNTNLPATADAPTPTLIRATYDRLRADVLAGRWAPGRKLPMHELRHRYQVGASPLREALNRLASEEWVVHNEQRGFSVADASAERLQDLVATRIAVESLALERAFAQRSAAWEERLVLAFHRLSRVPRACTAADGGSDENPEWERLHRAFHQALLAGCGSPLLLGFCEQMYDQAFRYRQLARRAPTPRNELDEHRAVFDAVIGARLADAQALMAEHYRRTAGLVSEQAGSMAPGSATAATGDVAADLRSEAAAGAGLASTRAESPAPAR